MAGSAIWSPDHMEAFRDAAVADAMPDHEGRDLNLPLVREQFERDRARRNWLGLRVPAPPSPPPPVEPRHKRPRRRRR